MRSFIQFQKKDKTAFITLNRPEKKNALLPEMIYDLISVFQNINTESSLKAVVLKGEGDSFCSGADLHWLSNEKKFSTEEINNLFTLLETMYSCPIPVIGLVQGFVIGGGLGLVSVCDFVIAEKNTRFLFSETHLGLVPSVISPFILKKLPLSWAKFFMLSGRVFSSEEAHRLSLVHFTGTQEECDKFVVSLLNNLKKTDTLAVSKTKKLLNTIHLMPFPKIRRQCVQLISEMRKKPKARQKIQELLKKSSLSETGKDEKNHS